MKMNRAKKWLAENVNLKYRIFLFTFIPLMVMFLTSKMWLPSDVKIQNSEIGAVRNTSLGTALVLKSWQYNSSENFMEATFSYSNSDNSQSIKFLPVAHTDINKATDLNINIPYCNNGLLVVWIRNVPRKWDVISLWIDSQEEQINLEDDTESGNNFDTNSSMDDESMATEQGANFFCDIRKVVKNPSLKSQSKLYYSLKSIDNEIAAVKDQITQLNKKISTADANIQQLNFDISALKSNQKYQTADDISQSNSTIQNKSTQICDLKNNTAKYQSDIKDDQLKLQKLHQKWNDTEAGKYKEIDPPASENASVSSSLSSNGSKAGSPEITMVD